VLRCTSVPVDCYWHHFLTNITQYSLQFLRSTSRIPASRGCACTRERANACGLIVNDSSAKRMHAQQPGENASCASAGRNFKSDQTVGFSDSPLSPPLSFSFSVFFFWHFRDVNAATRVYRRHSRRFLAWKIMKRSGVTWNFLSLLPSMELHIDSRLSYYCQL